MTALVAMGLLGLICWVFRVMFIDLVPAEHLPAGFRDALVHLAPAVLSSIVAVELVSLVRARPPLDGVALLVAAVVVGLAAYRTRNLTAATAIGLAVVLVLDVAVPAIN